MIAAMSPDLIYGLAGLGVFGIGMWRAMTLTHPLRRVLALKLCAVGASFLLIVAAYRSPPVAADAVPHALVITGIVVMVSAMAVALALIHRIAVLERADTPPGGCND